MIALIFQNYYQRLQVESTASTKEISQAFRRLALQFHPDVADDKEKGHKIFLLIKEAHSVLSDPEKRQDYDQWLDASRRFKAKHPNKPRAKPQPVRQRAQNPQTQPQPQPQRGHDNFDQKRPHREDLDTYAILEISLEEAIQGGIHTITIESDQPHPARHSFSTFNVKIPPLAHAGLEILVNGKGAEDPITRQRGNLILSIAYARHHVFRLLGNDLYAMIDVLPWDAALGSFMQVPTLEGNASLRIPEGAQPWQKFTLAGSGMPNDAGQRGDLFLTLKFVFPKSVNPQQKLLWQQLKTAYRQTNK